MKKLKIKSWLLLSLLVSPFWSAFAKSHQQVEMADKFRAEGKIYVVVIIILIIVLGLLFYTYRIDKKIKKLEDKFDDQNH